MAHFLVISHEHGLLPLAWRLVREGHEVSVSICRPRYASCWAGKFTPLFSPGGKDVLAREAAAVIEKAQAGAIVLTDSHLWAEKLTPNLDHIFPTAPRQGDPGPLQLQGFYVDGKLQGAAQLLIEDRGLWTGGQGPALTAAVTAIRVPSDTGLEKLLDLSPQHPDGLVRIGLTLDEEGKLLTTSSSYGWSPLHYHAWAASISELGPALTGAQSQPIPTPFATAVTVSIPPYPTVCNVPPGKHTLSDLPKEVLAATMWHDVRIPQAGVLETAGADGLVGVVTATGRHWEVVRPQATASLHSLGQRLPEAQYRVDFGQNVGPALSGMWALGLEF